MKHINIEIKARCKNSDLVRSALQKLNADFKGTDIQTDTYFNCKNGRLKLRQGTIENNLIFYNRMNQSGPKQSNVSLYPVSQNSEDLRHILGQAMDIWKIVQKKREIYFIDNVKFHIDEVKGLGSFVEIEAIEMEEIHTTESLNEQCRHYMDLLDIQKDDLLTHSYSDMIDENKL